MAQLYYILGYAAYTFELLDGRGLKKKLVVKNKDTDYEEPAEGQVSTMMGSEEEAKSMGSLSGIATLRRSGDVSVEDDETHKVMTSVFTVGPLQLEVSKSVSLFFFSSVLNPT